MSQLIKECAQTVPLQSDYHMADQQRPDKEISFFQKGNLL